MQSRHEWGLVALLVFIMLVKGVLWSLAFPLWQGPDEDDHYAVIQFIAETGRLPDEADVFLPDEVALSRALADVGRIPYAPEQRQTFSQTPIGPNEGALASLPPESRASVELQATGKLMHATPFYYVVAAAVYRLFDNGDLLYRAQIQRIFAVVVGAPLVVVAYLFTRLLYPHDAAMRLTIPALVAFHPMITEITAVVSVDGLLILCYSLLIYLSLVVLQSGLDWRLGLAMGLVFSVGMLTKPTLSGYAPVIALLVAYDWWRGRERRRAIIIGALVLGVVILLPVGWWMQRSYRINHGDFFYFNPVIEGHRIVTHPLYDYAFLTHAFDYYHSVWGGIFTTWWAHFGWLDTALPPWVYFFLRGLTFLALGGLVYQLVRTWRAGRLSERILPWSLMALAILLPVFLLQYYDLSFWHTYGLGRGLQGRYWLGTVIPMLLFWVAGLLAWLPTRWHAAAHLALRFGLILLNFVSLLGYILPRYYL
ncbi:MAG: glycosyltransferase family 39 protein [Chloroflexi bacterium]|nr:glycosyltransferase family 39 protein [Chloroflexota bacterium]MBP8059338.1 glycosyltransferase family 39 protein [Chloroflexota bacterium]